MFFPVGLLATQENFLPEKENILCNSVGFRGTFGYNHLGKYNKPY